MPNQISIDLRPSVVAERGRFGDWKADLVIEAAQKQALVTMNERTSRYSLIAHVPFKTAQAVSDTTIALLRPFASCARTLATDNGKEFAQHERIASALDADFFFAHPYASWESGSAGARCI
jgi:IS30 family transposase